MEKWQAYEAYLEANGWDVLPIKEFLRITGFLQVEGELAAHYDLDTYAALLRFLQAHNEESSFDEMVQWDGISLIPLVLLEHLKKKGEANRLYYGKHKKGLWDFIAGFMLGFTKGAASLTAGFVIFAGGTLKFFINMIFRPFKTGKETFDALCRIPGAIVNLFKAIKVAYQEKVINGNLFTMGEFFGGATFEGTAIVIPIGIAKELSWLARFENWLIRLHLPQKGILGLLTHGTRNVAVYAVRGMRMVEQKISQGVRFVVLRLTTTLRSVWGNIKGSVRKVIDSLGIKEFWDKLKEGMAKKVDEVAEGMPKAGAGNLIKDSSSYKELAKNHSAEDLIKNLEGNGWTKVVDPPRSARSGEAIKFTNPENGDVIRIMPNPADGKPYFKVQNKDGGWLDEFGNFPSNATKQELRDLTHFYFEK